MKIDNRVFEIGHISNNQSINPEYWMTNLSPLLRQLPIMYLCIPGSIKSYSYSESLSMYQKYQSLNITNQLMNGVRYLYIDIYWDNTSMKWMCDKYISLDTVLRQINIFAMTHSNEIVFMHVINKTLDNFSYISTILNKLSHILFERTVSELQYLWYSLYSLNSICNTRKNIIFIHDKFYFIHCIFQPSIKHITTSSVSELNNILQSAPVSICNTFQIPKYLIKINWTIDRSTACKKCVVKYNDLDLIYEINASQESIYKYIHSKHSSTDMLNKIFILCTEFENYMNLLDMCMKIMNKRFYQ